VGRLQAERERPLTADSLSGKTYVFATWSDGKGQQHDIVTGATPSAYTVTFKACTKTGTSAGETLTGTSSDDVICGLGGNDALNSRDGVSCNDSLDGGPGTDTKTTDATEKSIVGFP
jgi:Ca2+-binding RTX toxin-like protein